MLPFISPSFSYRQFLSLDLYNIKCFILTGTVFKSWFISLYFILTSTLFKALIYSWVERTNSDKILFSQTFTLFLQPKTNLFGSLRELSPTFAPLLWQLFISEESQFLCGFLSRTYRRATETLRSCIKFIEHKLLGFFFPSLQKWRSVDKVAFLQVSMFLQTVSKLRCFKTHNESMSSNINPCSYLMVRLPV